MIQITDKHNCCGCSACVQACPKQCIDFIEDEDGFKYPHVNLEKCVDCGLCEKVCPCINMGTPSRPIKAFAAVNPNLAVRLESSSGGIFSALAEYIINNGGVVFGACYDSKWNIIHNYAETLDDVVKFRGSKYVQSNIGDCFIKVRSFLKNGRLVLFSGTSCQISGLKRFLQKEYASLICVDVVCHGVPSPLLWQEYLNYIIKRPEGVAGKNTVLSSLKEKPVITGISFRDKQTGWKKYGFVAYAESAHEADKNSVLLPKSSNKKEIIIHEVHRDNLYMQFFLNNLCLRPSCFKCRSKGGRCGSDFTLADFWGISEYHNELDDDKGVSAVLVNTQKAQEIISKIDIELYEYEYNNIYKRNHSLEHSVKERKYVKKFWAAFHEGGLSACIPILSTIKPPLSIRCYSLIVRLLRKLK